MKQKRDREEACFTCGHYHDFEGGEPCSICGHVIAGAASRGHESVMPTTVIPGFLYLGNYDTASRQELLKAMNITDILNTVPDCQTLYKNTFTYHTVAASPPDFEECFTFLDGVNARDKRVLVYCMSGFSRSPTVVVAYLMKLRGWRLAEAYKWVKDKRPSINITAADTKRLTDFELQLQGSCSVPFGLTAVTIPGSLAASAATGEPQPPASTSFNAAAASPQAAAHVGTIGPFAGNQWAPIAPAVGGGGFGSAPLPSTFVFGAPDRGALPTVTDTSEMES